MNKREMILKEVERLAAGRVNDGVKLAFLEGGELALLDKLDLSALSEFKRLANGGVEMKFVDRLAALQWLLEQVGGDPEAERLRQAFEAGGARLREGEEG